MRNITRVFSLSLLLILLSACSSLKTSAQTINEPDTPAAADNPRWPKLALNAGLFYGILASEVAGQRGSAGAAANTYLELAQQTRDPRLAQRASEFAMFAGMMKESSAALSLWLELEPESAFAREQLFVTLLRTGKLAESESLLEQILQNEPERAPAVFVQLARLASLQSNKQATQTMVSHLAARYPKLPEARFALLTIAADNGDQATVDAEFTQLAELAPTWDLPVMWQLDRLHRKNLNWAINFIKQELARRPQASLDLRMAYPRLLVGAKRYDEALREFEKILQTDNTAEVYYSSGLISYQLKNYPEAERYLQQALNKRHTEADFIRLNLGQIAQERKEPARARRWYEQVGAGPHFLSAQGRLAALDAADGNLDQALDRLDGLGNTPQEKITVALLQSQTAREAKQYSKAYSKLSLALQQQPKTPELLYERSLVLDLLGNYKDSERDLKLILKEKPDDIQALNALGYILTSRTTRHKEALIYIERALKQDPENPMIMDSMGWVQFKLGRYQAANTLLSKAYTLLPDAEIAAHLGEVRWKLGRKDEARSIWQTALSQEGDRDVLQETMRRFGVSQ